MPRIGGFAASGGMSVSILLAALLLVGCGSGGASPGGGTPSTITSPTGPLPSPVDPFAELTYRLDLPAGWIVMGTPEYLVALDAGTDVADWLAALGLQGPDAFRAYEPMPDAGGLRVAMNQNGSTWDSSGPLQDATLLAGLPGVSGPPVGELVPVGSQYKASRFQWTQRLDWGDGQVSARQCVSYVVMGEYTPVSVVFTYPAGADRLADIEALMATMAVTGEPAGSSPAGPTPYDKNASTAPQETPHEALDLEELLPDTVGTVHFWKMSTVGVGDEPGDPVFGQFGKTPADFASAMAQSDTPPLFIIGVLRLSGVPGSELLTANLREVPADEIEPRTVAGRAVTYVAQGAWPVWYWTEGELVFAVAAIDEGQVLAAMEAMP